MSVFLVLTALFILASASAGLIGVFHAVSLRGSHSRSWGEVSFSFVPGFVAKNQGPSSLANRFAGFTVPAQPTTRQLQWETVRSCAGGQGFLVRLAAHRQRCERFLFAAECSTKELSKTTVSFWLRMLLSQVCRLSVTERSVLCSLSSVH